MKTFYGLLLSVGALSFLSACSEESNTPEPSPKSTQQVTQTTDVSLQKQVSQLEQSLQEITDTLNHVSEDYEKNYQVDEQKVNQLAKQLGKLARQAGEGARTLEETGKTLGEAIQDGFNEGYQKKSN